MKRADLQGMLEQGLSLAEIGRRLGRHESTVAYWVAHHGLSAVHADRCAARGGLAREQLKELVDRGMSIGEIADEVDRSKATVRHWLSRYELSTANPHRGARQALTKAAKDAGVSRTTMPCSRHGDSEFVADRRGYFKCARCRSEAVTRRRKRVKAILVAEAGGRCALCGYDRCQAALEFHHLVPVEKDFELSHRGITRSLARARAEAAKCVLLCSNCHAEVEVGFAAINTLHPPHLQ
jgi:transposase